VEHAPQVEAWLALGCGLGQCYHFSMPVTAEEIDSKWIVSAPGRCASRAEISLAVC
jgi:EAL domain-containing protein (putative c-di-GMP-specific phosphodiesterase class I)